MTAGEMTEAGWPRPQVDNLPVPWVSPADDLSAMHPARAAACASGAICAVCGLGYDDDDDAYVLVHAMEAPEDLSAVDVQAMDNGILHFRCLRLALGRCPKLRSLRDQGALQLVKTKGNSATVVLDENERPVAYLAGQDCEAVSLDSLGE